VQLKEYVDDLVMLVTGNRNQTAAAPARKQRSAGTIGTSQPKKAAPAKRLASRKTSEVRPDQMIPFDDDEDFKNF
jgi:methyl-accepting chemotaxis protein